MWWEPFPPAPVAPRAHAPPPARHTALARRPCWFLLSPPRAQDHPRYKHCCCLVLYRSKCGGSPSPPLPLRPGPIRRRPRVTRLLHGARVGFCCRHHVPKTTPGINTVAAWCFTGLNVVGALPPRSRCALGPYAAARASRGSCTAPVLVFAV